VSDFQAKVDALAIELWSLVDYPRSQLDGLVVSIEDGEVVVEGGVKGLAFLAAQCLDIARQADSKAHAHVEYELGADAGSIPLQIIKKPNA
jgi:hypothetical protein